VADLLQEMHARGLRQAMLSNNQGRFIRRILAAHQLDTWLEPIFGEEDVSAPKPGGEGILAIVGAWRVAPGEVLLVGDSRADAGAARAAGAPSVGVTWGTHRRDELIEAGFDHVIDHPGDLGGFVDERG
jgi:phosphoglycolate phosphatase